MSESACAAQQSALDEALRLFAGAQQAAEEFFTTAAALPPGDLSALSGPFDSWRTLISRACTAVREFCDACGPDGPDPELLGGATPPFELWSAGVDTLTASFPARLAAFDAAGAAMIAGGVPSQDEPDPARPVIAALGRVSTFLTDRNHDLVAASMGEVFDQLQRVHGGSVSSKSTITPGGGKRTEVSISFADPDADERTDSETEPTARSWWSRITHRVADIRSFNQQFRPFRNFSFELRARDHRHLHDALEFTTYEWIGHVRGNPILRSPYFATYFIVRLLNGLGHGAQHCTAEISTVVTSDDGVAPVKVRWEYDAAGQPPALIWLPDAAEIIDLFGGSPTLESGLRPQLITDITTTTAGTTFGYTRANEQIQYTIVDNVPCTEFAADLCQQMDQHVNALLAQRRFHRFHAHPPRQDQ